MIDHSGLQTTCSTCSNVIKFPAAAVGSSAKCPQCGELMRLNDPREVEPMRLESLSESATTAASKASQDHKNTAWGCLIVFLLFVGCGMLGLFDSDDATNPDAVSTDPAFDPVTALPDGAIEKNENTLAAFRMFRSVVANSNSAAFVKSMAISETAVVIEVADQWLLLPKGARSLMAEDLDLAWRRCVEEKEGGMVPKIHLVNRNGTNIGGTKMFGGVWVDD